MSASSDLNLNFDPSKDYVRCVMLFHAFVIWVVVSSGLSLMMSTLFVLLLLMSLSTHRSRPIPTHKNLSYHTHRWHLTEVNGKITIYERAMIRFDGGLFFLLRLETESTQKNLLIFYDQLSTVQWRTLKWALRSKL